MELDIRLTRQNFAAFQSYVQKKAQKSIRGIAGGFWANLGVFLGLIVIFFIGFTVLGRFHWPTFFFTLLAFVCFSALVILRLYLAQKKLAPSEDGMFLGTHRFEITPQTIRTRGTDYQGIHHWRLVQSVERGNGLVLIFTDTLLAHVFPEDQLEDPEAFFAQMKTFFENSRPPAA